DLGLSSIRVMTNNPRKLVGLEGYGLQIVERVPLVTDPNGENRGYLQVKRDKLGHLLAHGPVPDLACRLRAVGRVAILASRYNELITTRLLEGALACCEDAAVPRDQVDV